MSMDLGTASVFAKFVSASNTLTIAEGAVSPSDTRLHKIVLTLKDNNSAGALQTKYDVTLALEEELSSADPTQVLGDGLVNFHGVVASPAEIFQNITAL